MLLVFNHRAKILSGGDAGARGTRKTFVVRDAGLKPDGFRADRDRIVDDGTGFVASYKDIHEIYLAGDVAQALVGRFPKYRNRWEAAPVNGNDRIARPLEVGSDSIGGAVRSRIETIRHKSD